jgi:hypothetical protein
MPRFQNPLTTISQEFPVNGPPWCDDRPLSPPPCILPDLQKGVLANRDAPFPETSNYLLKFPVNGLPMFPNGPLQRETPVSRAFFDTFPSKFQVNKPPFMFPNRVPMERDASSPEPRVYSFISVRVPNKDPTHEKRGKIWSPSTEPHVDGRPAYSGVRPGSPRGSFTTPQSLPQCHAAFSTIPSTGRPEPR